MSDLVIMLPKGYQTVIDEADAPLTVGLTLYRGSEGYVYYSRQEHGKKVTNTLHALSRRNTSGVRGVDCHDGRWRARIHVDGTTYNLGCFGSIDEAAAVRRQAEVRFYGEEAPR